jgi:DNA-binding MarR family transcriptional regulator
MQPYPPSNECICTLTLRPVFPFDTTRASHASESVHGCTCARLRRLTRRVTAVYDRELAAAGLRVTQYALLGALQQHQGAADGVTVSALAERMDMDRTTLTRNLKPLLEHGWISLAADPDDARARRVRIGAAGRAVCAAARPHWQRAQQQVNQALGEPAVAALHDWLDAVTPSFRP